MLPRKLNKPRTVLAGVIAGLLGSTHAQANPTGAVVAHGQARISQPAAGILNIANSPGAIINWKGFSIERGELTRFVQQSGKSTVLNRVTGGDPSAILGQLVSNGRVFLINPNGVAFGAHARVDTAGLVASTLDIKDADFIAGRYQFRGDDKSGPISNEGYIKAARGGEIVFIAPTIENAGTLTVDNGQLILAAGKSVKLASLDVDDVTFEVQAPGDKVVNLGKLLAEQGAIGVFAGTLSNSGTVSANTLSRDAGGRIVLSAQGDITQSAAAVTSASGISGGDIRITSANGTTLIDGKVDVRGSETSGGQIALSGARVAVLEHGVIDASGANAGGKVRIGGGWHGADATLANADKTTVVAGAQIRANATRHGDGGEVVVWSNNETRYAGTIAARAGAAAGDGGRVEVSGKEKLAMRGFVDVGALHGAAGQILFDPRDITITANVTTNDNQVADGKTLFGDDIGGSGVNNTTDDFTLSEGALEVLNGNVSLQANRNFTINAGLVNGLSFTQTGQSFTVQAGGSVSINSPVSTTNGVISLTAGDPGATGALLNATLAINAPLATAGSAIRLSNFGSGANTVNASLNAAVGDLVFNTAGLVTFSNSTLTGGILSNTNPAGGFASSGSAVNLAGLTLASNFTVSNASTVTVFNGLVLSNNAKVNINSTVNTTDLRFTGTQTVSGTGELVFNGTQPFSRIYSTNANQAPAQVLTLGPGITVRANVGGELGLTGRGLDIQGTVIASAGTLAIDGLNWVNEGTLRVAGGLLSLRGTWGSTAAGKFDVQSGTLQLDGSFKTADLNIGAGFTRSGGAVNITGTLDNSNDTLALDASTGAFNLSNANGSGVVSGGLITGVGSNVLGILASQQGTLDGVTLASDFTVSNGALVTVTNGLVLSNNAKVNINSTVNTTDLRFTGTQTVSGTGELVFNGTQPFSRIYSTNANQAPAQVLTLGPGITVRANVGGELGLTGRGLDIQGTVIASAGTLAIDGLNWVNEGTLRVAGGLLSLRGTWGSTAAGKFDVQSGTLQLDGSFKTADLNIGAGFTRSGGAVNITGTLDNSNDTLALDASTGAFNLSNANGSGVVSGGLITGVGSNVLGILASQQGTLDGVTLASDFTVSNGALVTVTNGLVLSNNAKVNINSTVNTTDLRFTGTQTVSGTGELVFNGTQPFSRIYSTNANQAPAQVLTLGPGVTVRANVGGELGLTGRGLDIQGTVIASAGTLAIDGLNWVNEGTLRVAGGLLSLRGTWGSTAAGKFDVQSGTLQLDGSFKTADLNIGAGFTRSGGAVNITGTLDNSNDTLALDASTGAFNLSNANGSGVVSGGLITGVGSNVLGILASQQGTLDGVTLASDFTVSNGALVTVTNGLVLSNNAKVNINSTVNTTDLRFTGTQTVSGTGELVFSGTQPFGRIYSTNANQNPAQVLTLGSGITVRSNIGGELGLTGRGLDIQGTVIANLGTLSIDGLNWVNEGVLRAAGGTLTLAGTWSSTPAGKFDVQGGTLNLGGSYTNASLNLATGFTRNGGTVNITGTLDNTGDTLALSATNGVFRLVNPGTIVGGTISDINGVVPALAGGSSGTLSGVTLDSDLTVGSGTTLFVTGDLVMKDGRKLTIDSQNQNTDLRFNGSSTLRAEDGAKAEVIFSGISSFGRMFASNGGDTLTIASNITVHGTQGGEIGLGGRGVINFGTIVADTAGKTFNIDAGTFTNAGTVQATGGGIIDIAGLVSNAGGLMKADASSTFSIAGTNWTNLGGQINVQGGTLNLGGSFTTAALDLANGFTRNGGTVRLTGIMNNTGNTLALTPATGTIVLAAGTIRGGTISDSGGVTPALGAVTSGTFDDVLLDADFTITSGSSLIVTDTLGTGRGLILKNGRKLTIDSQNQNTDLRVTGNQTLDAEAGGTAQVLFNGISSFGRMFSTNGNETLTLGPNLTVRGSQGGELGLGGRGLTNLGTIVADTVGKTFSIDAGTFINSGTVKATAGGVVDIASLSSNVGGLLQTDVGSTLSIAGANWSNVGGQINVQGGTLNLGGSFTTAALNFANGFTRNGGTVRLTGVMNNTGNTLALTPTIGAITLVGGTLRGGTISDSGGITPTLGSATSATFDNVLLDTDFTITSGSSLIVTDTLANGRGLILKNGRKLIIDSQNQTTDLRVTGNQTLDAEAGGSAEVVFTGISSFGRIFSSNGNETLTLGPNLTVHGTQGGQIGLSSRNLRNEGSIIADAAGRTFSIDGLAFNNVGTVKATAGGVIDITGLVSNAGGTLRSEAGSSLSIAGANWSNVGGHIEVQNGTVSLGGSFTTAALDLANGFTRNGGTVRLTGVMNNTGNILALTPATGDIVMAGGTIRGGTVSDSGGAGVTLGALTSGTLDDVVLDTNFTVTSGSTLFVSDTLGNGSGIILKNGRRLTIDSQNQTTDLRFNSTQTLDAEAGGTAELFFSGTGSFGRVFTANFGDTLTFGSRLTVRGTQGGQIGLTSRGLANQGVVLAEAAGKTFDIAGSTLTNTGTFQSSNGGRFTVTGMTTNAGTMNLGSGFTLTTNNLDFTNNGIFSGSGTVTVDNSGPIDHAFINNGSLRPGSSPGLLSIAGNLVLNAGSITDIEVQGFARGVTYDAINVTGTAQLGGTLNVLHLAPYTPANGDSFLVLTSTGTRSGSFANFNAPVTYNEQFGANSYLIQVGATPLAANFWLKDASDLWTTGANWSLGHAPTASEIAIIDRGVANPIVTLNAGAQQVGGLQSTERLDVSAGTLSLNGSGRIDTDGTFNIFSVGTVNGSGSLLVDGAFNYTGGSYGLTGTTTLRGTGLWSAGKLSSSFVVANGGVLNIAGGGKSWAAGASLANNGTVTWSSGDIDVQGAGTVTNNGLFDITGAVKLGDVVPLFNGDIATLTFNNAASGTLRSTSAIAPVLGFNGANSGVNLSANFVNLTNDGVIDIQGGGLRFNVGLGGPASLGGGVITSTSGSQIKLASGATLEFGGTATLAAGSTLSTDGRILTTQGSNLAVNGAMKSLAGSNSSATANIVASGGTATYGPSAAFSLASVTINGGTANFTTSPLTSDAVTLSSGVLGGGGSGGLVLAANKVGTWSGGTLAGALTISTGGVLNLTAGVKNLGAGVRLINDGTVTWSSGDIDVQGAGTVTNNGLFDITGAVRLGDVVPQFNGDIATLTFNNTASGTLRSTSAIAPVLGFNSANGGVTLSANFVNLTNDGVIDIQGGGLRLNVGLGGPASLGGGVITSTSGSQIKLAGGATLEFGGTATLAAGSTLNSDGRILTTQGSNLTVNGAMKSLAGTNSSATANIVASGGTATYGPSAAFSLASVTINGGTANFTTLPLTSDAVTLSSGVLGGGGSGGLVLAANKIGSWSGGTLAGALTISTGGVLTIDGGAKNLGAGAALTNNGTVTWSASDINVQGAGTVTNNGLFDITGAVKLGDVVPLFNGDIATLTFNNAASGTLRSTSAIAPVLGFNSANGGVTLSANFVNLTNDGVIDIQGGGLRLNVGLGGPASLGGGVITSTSGSQIKLAGGATLEFGGTATLAAGSTLNSDGRILTTQGSNLTVNGAMKSLAGTNSSATANIVASGGTATYGPSAAFSLASVTINGGTANFTTLPLTSDAVTLSSGVLGGGGSGGLVLAANKIGSWSGGTLAGALTISTGGVLTIDGGAKNLGAGAALTNNGTVTWSASDINVQGAGTVTNNGLFDITGAVKLGDVVPLFNGDIATLTFNNTASGTLRSTSAIAPVLGFNSANGGVTLSANFVNLTNDGVIDIQGGGLRLNVGLGGPASLGGGVITSTSGSQIKLAGGATLEFGGTATLAAGSTLNSDGRILTTQGSNLTVNGAMKSLAGTNSSATANIVASGGTATYGPSAAFSLASVTINGGTANFTTLPLTSDAVTLSSGVLGGGGSGGLVLAANKIGSWSGGTLAGALTISTGGVLTIDGGAKNLGAGAALTNNGTVTWSASDINVQGAGTVTNNGLFDITGAVKLGDVVPLFNGDIATLTFNNAASGTLRSTSAIAPVLGFNSANGGVTLSANFVNLTNDGVIDIQGGGLRLNVGLGGPASLGGGVITSTSGSQITIASGAKAEFGGSFTLGGSLALASTATAQGRGAFAITNGGILRGLGTIDLGGGTLQNGGTVAPGTAAAPAGTLTLLGNYSQSAGGTLAIDLAGSSIGQFDVLSVSGTATLAGTLSAGLINGFQPGPGSQFTIIQAGARNGDFTTKTLPLNFLTTPGATYVLSLSGAVCSGSICFDNSGGDFLWSNPLNWTTDLLPAVSDAVVIDLAGNNTIVFNSGIHTIGSLVLSGNNALNIAAGTLVLGNDSTLAGTVRLNGGNFTIDAVNVALTDLVHSGGALAINAGKTLTVNGQYNWTAGGSINGPGTLALAAGSGWNINDSVGGGFHTLDGVTVNNAGTVNYSVVPGNNRELLLNSGAAFNNQAGAVFDFKSDVVVTTTAGGGVFTNRGLVKKSGGTGNSGFASVVLFNNIDGTVDSGTGTLLLQTKGAHSGTFTVLGNRVLFNGANHSFADGSVLNGVINFSGAAITLGTATINDTLNLSGGTVGLGSKTTTMDGVLNWTSGATVSNGTLALTAANVATINDSVGGGFHTLDGVTVNNAGTVNYSVVPGNNRELLLNSGAAFNNQAGAVFDFKSDVVVTTTAGGGVFTNRGLVKKSGGTGNSGFASVVLFNNIDGTVDSGSGTLLLQTKGAHSGTFTVLGNRVLFNGANHSFADGSVLNGVINFSGAAITLGTATINDTLNLSGGTVSLGSKTTTMDGVLNWTSGATVSNGTLALTAANVATINDSVGGGFHTLDGVTVNNAGTVNYSVVPGNNRELLLNSGAAFNNQAGAVFDFKSDVVVTTTAGGGVFTNRGLVKKSGGTGNSGFASVVLFNNIDGTVDSGTGTLLLQTKGAHSGTFTVLGNRVLFNGANHSFADGSVLNGVINFSGAAITLGTATINDTLNLSGGTVSLGSKTTTMDGVLNWTSGATVSNGTLALTAANVATINDSVGSGFHTLDGVTVNNAGTVNYSVVPGNNRELVINNGSQFDNLAGANFDIQGDIGVVVNAGCAPCRFDNHGVVVKSAGTGIGGLLGNVLTVTNHADGTFRANSGTLRMNNFTLNSGTIDTAGGAVFDLGAATLSNDGTLSGRGSFDIATVINNGSIAPTLGAPLRFTGNLLLGQTSVLNFDIGGTNRGVNHDAIDVQGKLSAGGSLRATLVNGFVPGQNTFYTLISAKSVAGSFANTVLPASFTVAVNPADVSLHFFNCAGSVCFDNSGGDFLWSNPLNWTTDLLPTVSDAVVVDLAGNNTIVFNSGIHTIGSLVLSGNNALNIAAGTLVVSNDSTLAGSVRLGGGNFTIDAVNVALTDVVHSGGTLAINAGKTLTVNGQYNWTAGGTINGPGTITFAAGSGWNINDSAGAGFHTLSGVTLNNAGTVSYNVTPGNSRELLLNNGAAFNNQAGAVFDFKSDALVSENTGGGVFTNRGVVMKSAGTGNSGFGNLALFNNINGTLDSGSGTLLLGTDGAHSGTFTVLGNRVLFNAGSHSFADGSVLNGVINLAGATLNFGNATINDTLNVTAGDLNIAGARILSVDGVFNWSAGTRISGPGTLATSAVNVWNINDSVGAGFHELSALTVRNSGVVNYKVQGGNGRELLVNNGSQFLNLAGANFDIQGDIGVLENAGCDPCGFDNHGVVVKSAGTGIGGLLGNLLTVTNHADGTFRANSGTLRMNDFSLNSGTIDTAGGAVFDLGAATLTNAGTLSGRGSFDIATVINNGRIAPSLGAPLRFTGDLQLGQTSVLNFDIGGTNRGVNHDAIDVQGNLSAGGSLRATLVNGFAPRQNTFYRLITAKSVAGSFAGTVVPASSTVAVNPADVSLHFFNCAGSICFDNESGDFQWNNPRNWTGNVLPVAGDDVVIDLGTRLTVILNGGSQNIGSLLTAADVDLDLSAGLLRLQSASTMNGALTVSGAQLISNAALTVAGNLAVNAGSVEFNGATDLRGNLTLSNGSVAGAGNVTVARLFNWTGGSLGGSGSLTVANGGRLQIAGDADKFLDDTRRLTNLGSMAIQDGDLVLRGAAAQFINRGQLSLSRGAGIVGDGRFDNDSAGRVTLATPDVSHIGVTTNNNGSIVIESGVLAFDRNFTNRGDIDLGADQKGGLRAGNIDVFANGLGGRIFGSGFIDVADAGIAFSNAGVIAPGHSPGVISILGDFVQTSTGRLAVEIGGTRPGLEFDLLNVSGRASLAGAIELDLLNNFRPAAGGSFDVVNSATLVGDFESVTLPSGQVLRGAALAAVYQISAAALLSGSAPTQDAIDNVLVMPSVDIGRATGSIVVNDGVGEPLIEFVPRRRAKCN